MVDDKNKKTTQNPQYPRLSIANAERQYAAAARRGDIYFQTGLDLYKEFLEKEQEEYRKQVEELKKLREAEQQLRIDISKGEDDYQKNAGQETNDQSAQTTEEAAQKLPKSINEFKRNDWAERYLNSKRKQELLKQRVNEAEKAADRPLSTPMQQLKEAANEFITANAAEQFDVRIQELEVQKQQLENLIKQLPSPFMINGVLMNKDRDAIYQNKLAKVNLELKDLKSKKDQYVNTMDMLTDPTKRFRTILKGRFLESDAYSRINSAVVYAEAEANRVKQQGWGTTAPEYRKALTKWYNALQNKRNVDRKFADLQKYIQDLGYIPTMNELPERLKDIAKDAFTKDGKNLLEDRKAVDELASERVVFKDEFGTLSKIVSDNLNSTAVSEEQIDAQMDRIRMLRDYAQSQVPMGQRILGTGKYQIVDETYDAALDALKQAKRHKELNERILSAREGAGKAGITYTSLIGGLEYADNFVRRNWMGVMDREGRIASNLYLAEKKLSEGKEISEGERALLEAKVIEDLYKGLYGNYLNERGYKWGQITAESLQFMAQFLATGGLYKAALKGVQTGVKKASVAMAKDMLKRGGKAAEYIGRVTEGLVNSGAAAAYKQASTDLARKAIAEFLLAKYGPIRTGTKLLEIGGRLGTDAAYAGFLENTLGLPKVMRDAYEQSLGKINVGTDFAGNMYVDSVKDVKDFTDSLRVSETRNWIENFSEMMGEWGIGKGLKYIGTKIPKLGNVLRAMDVGFQRDALHEIQESVQNYIKNGMLAQNGVFAKSGWRSMVPKPSELFNRRVLRNGQFHGFLGEVSEEYYGLVLQHALGVQEDEYKTGKWGVDLWNDIMDQSVDIWGGIALSTGLLGAIGMGTSVLQQQRYKNAEQNLVSAFGADFADNIRRQLLFANNYDIADTYVALSQAYAKPSERTFTTKLKDFLNIDGDKKSKSDALRDYFNALLLLRGAVYGEEAIKYQMGVDNWRLSTEAKEAGYRAGTYRAKKQAEAVASLLRQDINSSMSALGMFDDDRTSIDDILNGVTAETSSSNKLGISEFIDAVIDETPGFRMRPLRKNELSGDIEYGDPITESVIPSADETEEQKNQRESQIQRAKDTKRDLIKKVVAYNNALNHIQAIDFTLDNLVTERAKRASRTSGRLLNVNDLKIHPLSKTTTIKNSKGEDEQVTNHLYLIKGDLQKSAIEGEQGKVYLGENVYDSPYVLVANEKGEFAWMDRNELKDWYVEDPLLVVSKNEDTGRLTVEGYKLQMEDAVLEREWNQRQEYLKGLEELDRYKPLQNGITINLANGKRITVLDAQPRNTDVVFSVLDSDNSNALILRAKNFDEFMQTVDQIEKSQDENGNTIEDITRLFLDQAEEQTRSYIDNRVQEVVKQEKEGFERYKTLQQERIQREELKRKLEELAAKQKKKQEEEERQKDKSEKDKTKEERRKAKEAEREAKAKEKEEKRRKKEEERQKKREAKNASKSAQGTVVQPEQKPVLQPQTQPEPLPIEVIPPTQAGATVVPASDNKGGLQPEPEPTVVPQKPEPAPEPKPGIDPPSNTDDLFLKLKDDVAKQQAKKIGTSSYHYFVDEGGKTVLYRRVHSEQTDQYQKSVDIADDLAKELYSLIKNEGVDALDDWLKRKKEGIIGRYIKEAEQEDAEDSYKQYLKEAVGRIFDGSVNIEEYKKYIKQFIGADGKILEDGKYYVYEAAIGIANCIPNIILNTKKGPLLRSWQSVEAGNIYDTILRYVINEGATFDSVADEYSNHWVNDPDNPEGPVMPLISKMTTLYAGQVVPINSLIDEESFLKILTKLFLFKEYLESKGWKLYSQEPMFLTATLAVKDENAPDGIRIVKVAGETDCIAINNKGERVLIDFKTYRSGNKKYGGLDSDFYVVENGMVHSTAAQYYQQFWLYNLLASQNSELFAERYAFLLGIDYGSQGKIDLSIDERNVDNSGFMGEDKPTLERLDDTTKQADPGVQQMSETLENKYGKTQTLADISKEYQRQASQYDIDQQIRQYEQLLAIRAAFALFQTKAGRQETIDDVKKTIADQINEFMLMFTNIVYYDNSGALIGHNNNAVGNFVNDIDSNDDEESEARQALRLLANIMFVLNQSPDLFSETEMNGSEKDPNKVFTDIVNTIISKSDKVEELYYSYYEQARDAVLDSLKTSESTFERSANLNNGAEKARPYTIDSSVSADGKRLEDVIGIPNFINDAEFYVLEMSVDAFDDVQYGIIIRYEGVEYSPVFVNFPDVSFRNHFKNLFEGAAPNTRIRLKNELFFRSFGHFDNENGDKLLDLSKNLAFNEQLSDVRYSEEGNICITRGVSIDGKVVVIAQKPSGRDGKRTTVFTYAGNSLKTKPSVGTFVYMYNPGYQEMLELGGENTDRNSVPVNLIASNLTLEQAQFVADYLYDKDPNKDDKSTSTGFSVVRVANLLINIGEPETNIGVKPPVFINYVSGDSGDIVGYRIVGRIRKQDGSYLDSEKVYLINSNEDKALLIQDLQNVKINLDEQTMRQLISDTLGTIGMLVSSNSNIAALFSTSDLVELADGLGIKIDKNDLSPATGSAMSTIAWFMKNGLITSEFRGFKDIPIYIDDFGIESSDDLLYRDNSAPGTQEPEPGPEPDPEVTEMDPESIGDEYLIDIDRSLLNESLRKTRIVSDVMIGEPLDLNEAKERIRKIVGDVMVLLPGDADYYKHAESDQYLQEIEGDVLTEILGGHMKNGVVVAGCYADMIILSLGARAGDEYHEAFHRVLELLVAEKLRNKAYEEYRKRFKKREEEIPTDRQIAEIAADEFAYFVQNRPHFKWSWNVLKMLKTIWSFYKFYTSIGSLTLWRLYKNAENGKYAKIKPSPEAIERFLKFANNEHSKEAFLASTINSRELGGLTAFIDQVMRNPDTYRAAGKELDVDISYGATLTIEDIINSPDVKRTLASDLFNQAAKKRLIDFLGIKTSESGKPLMKKGKFVLVDNESNPEVRERLQGIIESALIKMKAYQTSAKTNAERQRREEKNKNLQGLERGTNVITDEEELRTSGAIANGEYQQVSYEFEPITRASARVKLFFSSVMDMTYQEIFDVDSATNKGRIAICNTSDVGLPLMLDYKLAWSRVINRMFDIDTIQDLLDELEARKENSYMFDFLYRKFMTLMKEAFEYETDSERRFKEFKKTEDGDFITKDSDTANVVMEIVSVIGLAKTRPLVGVSHQSEKEANVDKYVEVFDADENAMLHSIKNDWSASFASGALPVMLRVIQNGEIKLIPNKKEIYEIIHWFSGLSNVFGEVNKKDLSNIASVEYTSSLRKARPAKDKAGNKIPGKFIPMGEMHNQKLRFVKNKRTGKVVIQHLEQTKKGPTWVGDDNPTAQDVKDLMIEFVKRMNSVGVMISLEDLEWITDNMYCVNNKHDYVPSKYERFRMFIKANAGMLFGAFNKNLKIVADYKPGDKISPEFIWANSKKYGFEYSGMIDTLSWGRYQRIADDYQTSHLTINGKKQYDFGERNFIYDRLRFILRLHSDEYKHMSNNPYYVYKNAAGLLQGSIVLKSIASAFAEKNTNIISRFKFKNLPGMKTDEPGDSGIEYLDLSEMEDYMIKYSILLKNGIILPTLSDKTTYGAIWDETERFSFGFNWLKSLYSKDEKADDSAQAQFSNEFSAGHYHIDGTVKYNFSPNPGEVLDGYVKDVILTRVSDTVLDLFIEYAVAEYISARYELARIKNTDGSGTVEDKDKVARFHKGAKVVEESEQHTVVLGARLSTFTGIYKFNEETGNYDFISFNRIKDQNGKWVSEEANLQVAEQEFFSKSKNELREIMNKVLCYQIQKELDKLVQIGAIKQNANGCYQNVEFLRKPLGKAQYALNKFYNREYSYQDTVSDTETDVNNFHSRSIVLLVSDLVCKSQMSMQESFRLYSGNLAYFKWLYDDNGILKDSTTDLFKRLGGLVSTGAHNVEDVDTVNKKLRCAEIVDEMIELPFQDKYRKLAPIQTYRQFLRQELLAQEGISVENSDKYFDTVEKVNESVNKIESVQQLKDEIRKAIKARRKTDTTNEASIDHEIDGVFNTLDDVLKSLTNALGPDEKGEYPGSTVNDGATYITDDLCKMLLISLGKFEGSVKEAFELLTSDKYNNELFDNLDLNDALAIADAYNKITTEVIGTQKYMAYGQRFVKVDKPGTTVTLQLSKDESITNQLEFSECESYYDKPAFFPLFRCIATGHQLAVLEKMKSEGVDVLKVTGATKVGNKGAVKCDKNTFKQWDEDTDAYDNFGFNVYEQNFRDFRKQFNTDPKGTEFMTLGTQYQKVVLSLLSADDIYTVDGQKISAKEMRDQIMTAFNKYLDARTDRFKQRFYTDGKVDAEKLKKIMTAEIDRMEASDPVAEAFNVEEVEVDGKKIKRFVMPIAAMSNTNWLQSVVASIVNKDLIDVVMPGNAFYQRSAFMMEGQMSDKLNEHLGRKKQVRTIIDGSKMKGNHRWAINHGMPLQEVNEEGSMDIVLSIDFFDYIFNEHPELKYQSFDRKKEWLIKNGIISGFSKEEEPFIPKKGDSYIDDNGDIVNVEEDQTVEITARKWHDATAQIVGYRIPTQAVSSIHALRCVDVIPVVRDTIVLPKGITAITGSDFDIDKFFLSTLYYKYMQDEQFEESLSDVDLNAEFEGKDKNYHYTYKDSNDVVHNVRKEGEKYIDLFKRRVDKRWERVENEIGSNLQLIKKRIYTNEQMRKEYTWLSSDNYNPETEGDKYYGNMLIKSQINLLKRSDNNISKLHGAIDSDTEPLKQIAKKLEKRSKSKIYAPFDMTSLVTNITSKMSFAIGKKGIGPFALNNNNHVLTYLYNVQFAQEFDESGRAIGILDVLGLRSLARLKGDDGRFILSWISGLINAHVDVAKDPYIRSLGVNAYTYNLVSLLIRTGYGYNTFWFTTQPIMNRLYTKYDRASGVYNQKEGLSKSQRQREAVNNFYTDLISRITGKNYDTKSDALVGFKDWLNRTYFANQGLSDIDAYNKMVVLLMKGEKGPAVMEKIATTPEDQLDEFYDIGLSHGGQNIPVSYKAIQGLVLAINDLLLEKARGLSQLVQYTKIDTKKQGININEQRAYYDNWSKLTDFTMSQFEQGGIEKMVGIAPEDSDEIYSFVGYKTYVAIKEYQNLLAGQIFEASEMFDHVFDSVRSLLNVEYLNADNRKSISRMIVAKMKADYFFNNIDGFCLNMSIDPVELIGDSDLSIAYKLIDLKAKILDANNSQFDELRDENGLCNNYLLNNLVVDKTADSNVLYGTNNLDEAVADQWEGAQFVRPLNIFGDSLKSDDMQNAWRDLLNSSNEDVRRFANELVVYAFMTSAELGGKYDLFKFVPPSWRVGKCTGLHTIKSYSSYIYDKLYQLQRWDDNANLTVGEIDDLVLDFYWDDNIVPVVSEGRLKRGSRLTFSQSNSGIIAGINASGQLMFEDGSNPRFFKVRNKAGLAGQNQYDIYQLFGYGTKQIVDKNATKDIVFPLYGKIQATGGKYPGGLKIFLLGMHHSLKDRSARLDFINKNYAPLITVLNDQKIGKLVLSDAKNGNMRMFLNSLLNETVVAGGDRIPLLKFLFREFAGNEIDIPEEIQASTVSASTSNRSFEDAYNRLLNTPIDYTEDSTYDIPTLPAVDIFAEMNDLRLDKLFPDTYSKYPSKGDIPTQLYDIQFVNMANNFGINVEYYKKRFVSEKDGKQYWKPVVAVSMKNHKSFGFFELTAEIDETQDDANKYTGNFSVNFNTLNSTDNAVDFVKFPLSESQKTMLLTGLTGIIKGGSKISISESVSEENAEMFQRLISVTNVQSGYFEPYFETSSNTDDDAVDKAPTMYVKKVYSNASKVSSTFSVKSTEANAVELFLLSKEQFKDAWAQLTPYLKVRAYNLFNESRLSGVFEKTMLKRATRANLDLLIDYMTFNSSFALKEIEEKYSSLLQTSLIDREETNEQSKAVEKDTELNAGMCDLPY